ncbi:4-(cytidine 5'-diphospho)-2-C-methyl-D-erythritol kinase [Thioalkalivibrio denitrificans]|uniref:4-diphosphocytidyl-2-C-methyl-D-erythritol kinase n=1 Tax=Thioalkalivibrio denitrificans TaxID=108003 RepID=A0A1V3NDX7_9GAMM|nr:4-(cytidine 5'-diphospho)-2-C-methyl-D-erythritol kinase [Thioalkalivibrio denitrificans]OOG23299.1 4-(cytidine 5'-diphospho)-2-C-methyl-D-erythritol kinase [Thioalkalivibrio denitrificans]
MSESWSRDWPAPGKLNLFLHVTGRKAGGYHLLQTVFQPLSVGDVLDFLLLDEDVVRLDRPLPGVLPEQDLTVRAARCLKDETGYRGGVRIRVDKRLPMGGGLGGGSSDAATVLVALNRLWELGLGEDRLAALGLALGADVPVFVRGRAAWAEGVGDELTPVDLPERWFVVIDPGISLSTAELFADPELTRNCPPITIADFLSGRGVNVFEPLARARSPELDRAMAWLEERAGRARLTGTGACVFASVAQQEDAESVVARVPKPWRGFAAQGLNRSPLLDRLDRADPRHTGY